MAFSVSSTITERSKAEETSPTSKRENKTADSQAYTNEKYLFQLTFQT